MRRTIPVLFLLAVLIGLGPGGLLGSPAEETAATESAHSESADVGNPEAAHGPDEGGGHGDGHEGGGHQSPVTPVLLALVIMLISAKIGGRDRRARTPAGGARRADRRGRDREPGALRLRRVVLPVDARRRDDPPLSSESSSCSSRSVSSRTVREMMSVGASSLFVALLGIVAPFFLGWGLSAKMLPNEETLVHLFIGATLCATSVGITARVLTDLGKVGTREAKIILGAAVIDDVLGLVILAVVSGVITATNTGGELAMLDVAMIVFKAFFFLVGSIVIGSWLSPRMFSFASKLRIRGLLLTLSLSFCFLLAYLANVIELAPIVGAFAAGLILDEVHYREFLDRGDHSLEDLIHPIAAFSCRSSSF